MTHVVCAAVRDAQPRELVVAPERAVHEHDVAGGEAGDHTVVPSGEGGRVGDDAAGRAVAEDEPAGLVVAAPGTTRRPGSTCLERPGARRLGACASRRRRNARASATAFPAERARRQRSPKTRTGVVDSRSSSRPAVWSISASVSSTPATGDARTPSPPRASSVSSCCRRSGEALTRNHGPSLAADRERRLRAGPRPDASARGLARLATAVPLREPAPGGRAQNANAHGPASAAYRRNRYEVTSEHRSIDLELGLDPLHGASY